MKLNVNINGKVLSATLEDNPSAIAFCDKLEKGPVSVSMSDYGGFEKVGALGFTLPRTDRSVTTEKGDIILYLGSQITIYYDKNSWNFTRLGRIDEVFALTDAFTGGVEKVEFSLFR